MLGTGEMSIVRDEAAAGTDLESGRSFAIFLAEAHDVRAGFDVLSDGHETAINSCHGQKSTNIRKTKS